MFHKRQPVKGRWIARGSPAPTIGSETNASTYGCAGRTEATGLSTRLATGRIRHGARDQPSACRSRNELDSAGTGRQSGFGGFPEMFFFENGRGSTLTHPLVVSFERFSSPDRPHSGQPSIRRRIRRVAPLSRLRAFLGFGYPNDRGRSAFSRAFPTALRFHSDFDKRISSFDLSHPSDIQNSRLDCPEDFRRDILRIPFPMISYLFTRQCKTIIGILFLETFAVRATSVAEKSRSLRNRYAISP